MSVEENKALVRRWIEALNQRNLTVHDDIFAPDVVVHEASGRHTTGVAHKQLMAVLLAAFPDLRVTLEDLIAEGDKVVARVLCQGTYQGRWQGPGGLLGIPPTGEPVTFGAMRIYRIAGGKVVEHWGETDYLGLMQQLGVMPVPSQGGQ